MAVAGRFMTKWEIVCGIVMIVGSEAGSDGLALRESFLGIEMVFWWVAVRFRRSSTACWIKTWPSSQNGRTNCRTFSKLVMDGRYCGIFARGNIGSFRLLLKSCALVQT